MAKQVITGNLNALKTLIEPFGWSIDGDAVRGCSGSTLKTIQDWCEDDEIETDPCPGSLWNLVNVPYDQRKTFKNENDVRALLFELMAYRSDFLELAKNPDGWIRILADNMSQGDGGSKYGTVFFDDHEGELAVWFGAKENMLPWMSGEHLRSAMNTLLDPKSVPAEPTPATASTPKSTNRRTLASPPPAASVSGPKSGKTKMVAKKETTPLIATVKQSLEFIDIDCIESDPQNDRKTFDKAELQELANSIKKHGILQPINLRPIHGRNAFMIVAGERRWRAAKLAGLREIPAQIGERDGIQVSLARLDENLKRVDLSPIEKAQAMKRIMDEHQLTQKELGEAVGVEQGQVSNMLRLLNLPTKLHSKIGDGEGQIAATTIRPALPFADVPAVVEAIEQLLKSGAEHSPRDVEYCVEAAIRKAGRSMHYYENWSRYAKPQKTNRYFEKVTASDKVALQIRKYNGEDYAFNVVKFDEMNAEPLKKLNDAHKKATAVSSKPSSGKSKSKVVAMFESKYLVENGIADCFAVTFADLLEKHRDKAASFRVCLAIAISTESLITDTLLGNRQWSPCIIGKVLEKLPTNPKQLEQTLRSAVVAMLREEKCNAMRLEEAIELQAALNADLTAFFVPSIELLDRLTDAGRDQLQKELSTELATSACLLKAWPVGFMPEFLRELVFPKPAADKKKKAKAA